MITTPFGNLLAFILTVSILVTFHEYGHFWVARRLGVKVLRFSVGFGRSLFSWRDKSGTEYVIAAIPLGGYVKMLDGRSDRVPAELQSQAFNNKNVWARIAIVAAGPLANFLMAIVVYWLMFMMGVPGIKPIVGNVNPDTPAAVAGLQRGEEILSINGNKTHSWQQVNLALIESLGSDEAMTWQVADVRSPQLDRQVMVRLPAEDTLSSQGGLLPALGIQRATPPIPAVIGTLVKDGAAATAGLKENDKIIRVNSVSIDSWQAWVQVVRAFPNKSLSVQIERDNAVKELELLPRARVAQNGREYGFIGARPAAFEWPPEYKTLEQYGPGIAVIRAVEKTWDFSVLSLKMLFRMVTGQVAANNIGGPISIAKGASQTLDAGFVHFLSFLGLVSISLALLNLLPIPVLDGGHLLFYFIEAMTGKPVSDSVQMMSIRVGMGILIAITLLAFYNDLSRVWG